jgi:hypothetical protein
MGCQCALVLILTLSFAVSVQVVSAELASLGQAHNSLQSTAAGLRQELANTQNMVSREQTPAKLWVLLPLVSGLLGIAQPVHCSCCCAPPAAGACA